MLKSTDRTIKLSFQITYIFLGAQVGLLLFFWKRLPPQLPLFYSHPWGEKQLVDPIFLALLPGISAVVSMANLAMIFTLTKNEKFLNQLLAVFSLIFNFLCFYTLIKILILVA